MKILKEKDLDFVKMKYDLEERSVRHNRAVAGLWETYGGRKEGIPEEVMALAMRERDAILEEEAALNVLLTKDMFPDSSPCSAIIVPPVNPEEMK